MFFIIFKILIKPQTIKLMMFYPLFRHISKRKETKGHRDSLLEPSTNNKFTAKTQPIRSPFSPKIPGVYQRNYGLSKTKTDQIYVKIKEGSRCQKLNLHLQFCLQS